MTISSPTMAEPVPLDKVDSLIDTEKSPVTKHRRRSSTAADVYNILDLERENTPLEIPIETQRLAWKVNTSPTTVEEKEYLALPLCTPKIKKIDLVFQAGLHVVARNPRGVTIRDAVDAIYKANKKKTTDELDGREYLRGFEWDPSECYSRFVVHLTNDPGVRQEAGKKKGKKAKKEKEAEVDPLLV